VKKSERVMMRGKNTKLLLSCAALLFLCMLACVVCVASARTIYVPDNYAKIKWAVHNATDGDTIIVRDGIYYEHGITVVNNSLTIKSENGSANCIIDGMHCHDDIISIIGGADNIKIEGFTIRNVLQGYGIKVLTDQNIIQNNVFLENNFGGILVSGDNNLIQGNTIKKNDTVADYGIRVEGKK